MTDTKQMEVNGKEIENISTNEQAQNGKEGNEMAEMESEKENVKGTEKYESEKTNEEEKSPEQKDDTTFDRFLSWWRGKPKGEARLKDDKDDSDVKDMPDYEKDDKITQNEKNGIQNKNEDWKVEKEEAREIKSEIIDSKVEVQSDDQSDEEVTLHHVTKQEIQSSISERRLEKIVEEQKHTGKTAPLALEEEEDFDSLDSRPAIDRPVDQPKTSDPSDTVEAGKDSLDCESQPAKDVEEKPEKRKSARVEAFVVLEKPRTEEPPQKSNNEKVNTPSENDEVNRDSRSEDSEVQGTHPGGKKDEQQSNKMDEVIEERHDDSRRESVKETWKRLEDTEKETGNKTYRVSYTIRTTTLDRKKNDEKPTEDEEEERLFGKTVLLNSTPQTQHEGPPPEDLESEIKEEHAREDEAATADIDRFFEICQEDAAPIAKDETESVPNEEETTPQTPDDIFRKLHGWDDEPTDWWTITKKKKEYDEWMKPMKDGTIRRVIIPAVEIPYHTSVQFITDWKHREEWDKTFSEIQILKSDKQSKVIYCPVKKRDLTFETLDREEADPPCYIMSWKRQDVIKEGEKANTLTRKKQKELQFITHTCGIIIRPSESGDQATKITILCQLEGPIDRVLRNTFLAGHPKTWLSNLKKYYKKQQKGDGKKVVYL